MSLKYISISGSGISINGKESTDPKEIGEAILFNLNQSRKVLDDFKEINDLIRLKEDFDVVSNWLMNQNELNCLPASEERGKAIVRHFIFFNKVVDMASALKKKGLK